MKKGLFCAAGFMKLALISLALGGIAAVHAQTALSSVLPKALKIPPAEEAFKAEARVDSPGKLSLEILGIPGVYFYQDKIKLTSNTKSFTLGKPAFPPSAMIDDETFGRTAVYRGAQQIAIPYSGSGKAELSLTMQGCHEEAKVCYPPQQFKFAVTAPNAMSAKSSDKFSELSSKNANSAPQVLDAEKSGPIRTPAALDAAISKAVSSQKGKYVMVDVWATWCAPCKEMERSTLADAGVKAALEKSFVLIKADVSAPGAASSAILKRYGLAGPPGFIFYGPNGKEISGGRLMGFTPTEKFLAHLKLVAS